MSRSNDSAAGGRTGFDLTVVAMVVMALLATTVFTACDADRADAVRHYNQGMAAFQSNSPAGAVEHMELALREDPTFHTAAYTMGQIQQRRLNDPAAAADSYRQALNQEPDNPRYAYRLGSALREDGRFEEAIEYFEEAIEHKPDYARAWYEKGVALDGAGEPRQAVDAFEQAIVANPRLRLAEHDPGGEHYHALADLYLRYRLHTHAADVYENGAKNNPDSPRLHHGLGVALMELDRHDEAIESFRAALDIDENHPSANFNIAVALHENGDTEAAVEQLEQLTERGHGMNQARSRAVRALLDDLKAELDE